MSSPASFHCSFIIRIRLCRILSPCRSFLTHLTTKIMVDSCLHCASWVALVDRNKACNQDQLLEGSIMLSLSKIFTSYMKCTYRCEQRCKCYMHKHKLAWKRVERLSLNVELIAEPSGAAMHHSNTGHNVKAAIISLASKAAVRSLAIELLPSKSSVTSQCSWPTPIHMPLVTFSVKSPLVLSVPNLVPACKAATLAMSGVTKQLSQEVGLISKLPCVPRSSPKAKP